MILNQTSALYKYAYSPEWMTDARSPESTTLCAFFWRCILGVPLLWFTMFIVSIALVIPGLIVTMPIWVPAWIIARRHHTALIEYLETTKINLPLTSLTQMIAQFLLAKKHKLCPIIEIK